jgi:hypothetical protein
MTTIKAIATARACDHAVTLQRMRRTTILDTFATRAPDRRIAVQRRLALSANGSCRAVCQLRCGAAWRHHERQRQW